MTDNLYTTKTSLQATEECETKEWKEWILDKLEMGDTDFEEWENTYLVAHFKELNDLLTKRREKRQKEEQEKKAAEKQKNETQKRKIKKYEQKKEEELQKVKDKQHSPGAMAAAATGITLTLMQAAGGLWNAMGVSEAVQSGSNLAIAVLSGFLIAATTAWRNRSEIKKILKKYDILPTEEYPCGIETHHSEKEENHLNKILKDSKLESTTSFQKNDEETIPGKRWTLRKLDPKNATESDIVRPIDRKIIQNLRGELKK